MSQNMYSPKEMLHSTPGDISRCIEEGIKKHGSWYPWIMLAFAANNGKCSEFLSQERPILCKVLSCFLEIAESSRSSRCPMEEELSTICAFNIAIAELLNHWMKTIPYGPIAKRLKSHVENSMQRSYIIPSSPHTHYRDILKRIRETKDLAEGEKRLEEYLSELLPPGGDPKRHLSAVDGAGAFILKIIGTPTGPIRVSRSWEKIVVAANDIHYHVIYPGFKSTNEIVYNVKSCCRFFVPAMAGLAILMARQKAIIENNPMEDKSKTMHEKQDSCRRGGRLCISPDTNTWSWISAKQKKYNKRNDYSIVMS